jgi:hypothetical protein
MKITLDNLSEFIAVSADDEARIAELLGIYRNDCILTALLKVGHIKDHLLDEYANDFAQARERAERKIQDLVDTKLKDAHICEVYIEDIQTDIERIFRDFEYNTVGF